MILAHHMGEDLIPTLVAGGGSAVSMMLLVSARPAQQPGRPPEAALMAVDERTTTEAAIVSAVLDYFEGWFDGDAGVRMERALHPDLAKRSLEKDGQTLDKISAEWMIEATGTRSRP